VATDEAGFKADFKKDLVEQFPTALIWTNTDMFRAGLPDMSALWSSFFFAMELKFIRKIPKRETSKCLTHEVSGPQLDFLNKTRTNDQYSCVLIGLQDVAVLMLELKSNYTLKEILSAPRIERVGGHWKVDNIFSMIRGRSGQE
jgi:hypothetical protein